MLSPSTEGSSRAVGHRDLDVPLDLRWKQFILTHSLRVHSPSWQGRHGGSTARWLVTLCPQSGGRGLGMRGGWLHCVHSQEAQKDGAGAQLAFS